MLFRSCEELRIINSEGQVDQRTSFLMEELFRIRRKGFAAEGAAHPATECSAASGAGACSAAHPCPCGSRAHDRCTDGNAHALCKSSDWSWLHDGCLMQHDLMQAFQQCQMTWTWWRPMTASPT